MIVSTKTNNITKIGNYSDTRRGSALCLPLDVGVNELSGQAQGTAPTLCPHPPEELLAMEQNILDQPSHLIYCVCCAHIFLRGEKYVFTFSYSSWSGHWSQYIDDFNSR